MASRPLMAVSALVRSLLTVTERNPRYRPIRAWRARLGNSAIQANADRVESSHGQLAETALRGFSWFAR